MSPSWDMPRLDKGLVPVLLAALLPVIAIPGAQDPSIVPRVALAIGGGCLGLGLAGIRLKAIDRGVLLGLLAVTLAAAIAAVFSTHPAVSVLGDATRYGGAVMTLGYVGLFGASACLLRKARLRRQLVSAYLLACAGLAVTAILEAWWWRSYRVDAYVGHPNLLGVLIAMAIPFLILRSRRNPLWLTPMPLFVVGLVLTGSRSSWLASAVATTVVVLLTSRRKAWLAMASGGLLMLLIVAVLISPLRSLGGDNGSARVHVWRDSLAMVAARPLVGWGQDTMGIEFGTYATGEWEVGARFDRAHTWVLDTLLAEGLVGLLSISFFWAAWLRLTWRYRRVEESVAVLAAWLGYALWVLVNFDWAPATAPLWLLAGLVPAVAQKREVTEMSTMPSL